MATLLVTPALPVGATPDRTLPKVAVTHLYGPNLVVDAGAEQATDDESPVPGWTEDPRHLARSIRYGVSPHDPADEIFVAPPADGELRPPDAGSRLFAGGGAKAGYLMYQQIDLATAGVKAGQHMAFSAWLGGYNGKADKALADLRFYDTSGVAAGQDTMLGAVSGTALPAPHLTGLYPFGSPVVVPAGAASARVSLVFSSSGGASSNGFADDIVLQTDSQTPFRYTNKQIVGTAELIPGFTCQHCTQHAIAGGGTDVPSGMTNGPGSGVYLVGSRKGESDPVAGRATASIHLKPGVFTTRRPFYFSGWFGKVGDASASYVTTDLTFYAAGNRRVGHFSLPAKSLGTLRGAALTFRSISGRVPPGSVLARIVLTFHNGSGYHYAVVDGLSFRLLGIVTDTSD